MQDESQELSIGGTADYSLGKAAVNVRAGSQKLSIVEKVGFSLGDAASNIFFQTFIMIFMFLYPLNKSRMAQVESELIRRKRSGND